MLKRKEFILGAAVGLAFAAAATAGGVIDWPMANAEPVAAASGRLTPSAGAAGLAFAPPQGAPLSFADIFDQVSPAVVQIDVKTRIERPRGGVFTIPDLRGFGFPVPDTETPDGAEGEAPTALGAGSGFFISADGYIVTNNHVVANAEEITVKLSDERELTARLIGRDEDTDLAVIKVEGSAFPFVDFEAAAEPRVGDWVIAVGNPFGLGGTATAGIVSARGRNLSDETSNYVDFLQIDAAINRGNSGGPTFDIYGRVIGVNSAIFSPTGGSVGIGFAIPASVAKPITDQLISSGAVARGYLGIGIQNFAADEAAALGLPAATRGAVIGSVTPGGPADRAGLQIGDIVTSVNGEPIETSTELTRLVAGAIAGQQIRLEILRDGRKQSVNVRSGTRPSAAELRAEGTLGQPSAPDAVEPSGLTVEGMTVSPLTPAMRQRLSVPENVSGLVITAVAPRSEAAERLQAGMIILRANNRPVTTPAELRDAIAAAKAANRPGVLLLVRAGGGAGSIVLPFAAAE